MSPLFHDSARSTLFPPFCLDKSPVVLLAYFLMIDCVIVFKWLWNWDPSAIKQWFMMEFCLFSHLCSLFYFPNILTEKLGWISIAWTHSPLPHNCIAAKNKAYNLISFIFISSLLTHCNPSTSYKGGLTLSIQFL